MPYKHRWTTPYRKGVLKKFYQLEDWYEANPSPLTMLSLTTYQDGKYSQDVKGHPITIPESFDILKDSWRGLNKALRYYVPLVPWVWIMEPHLTGYPHLHVVLFDDLSIGTQDAIKNLWTRKYQAGSQDHGVEFTPSKPDQGITSIRNYLMKYLAKSFDTTGSKYGEEPWTAGQLVFHALVRKNGWRLFDASRDLRQVMRCRLEPDPNTEYFATQFINGEGLTRTTWLKEGHQAPTTADQEEKEL